MTRVGLGYDIHALAEGRPLVLGGVRVPHVKGLVGHSDADVLTHAIIDALLGAAGLGNIGEHFPDTDPRYKGADSIQLLARTADVVRGAGYRPVNVDANIIAEKPRLAPFLDAMCARIAETLGIDAGCVSVKPRTNEGFGPEGACEAIRAQAVALIENE